MTRAPFLATCLGVLLIAAPATADIQLTFQEGAPKDRFILTNLSGCALPALSLSIDLASSASGVIFDVTASGAGVDVFQPFDLVSGAEMVLQASDIRDGDQRLDLTLSEMGPGQSLAFTIDVDDTSGQRGITVSGAELSGATLTARVEGREITGVIGPDNKAILAMGPCTS
jgi:hypothetical protein